MLGLFYNPNIQPAEEHERRLEAARQTAQELNFPLATSPYTTKEWLQETSGLENEPEGGKRCDICFRLRLGKTYRYLLEQGGDAFTTTLTVSRTKPAEVINKIGQEIGSDRFLPRNFKKKNGFERSAELAGKWGLYRQHYCGCVYSIK